MTINQVLRVQKYPGRGIIIGKTPDSKHACIAYFISGRSANSRNRIFVKEGDYLYTKPFDESKVEDPSLIIYAPLKTHGNHLVITNGDQTDTIYDALVAGTDPMRALYTREFEPDAPNYTPRISGIVDFAGKDFTYCLSILKAQDAKGKHCARYAFNYESIAGTGHFINTYDTSESTGDPLKSFCGEPVLVEISDNIDEYTDNLWNTLDDDNKISLYVRYVDLESLKYIDRLINKNK